MAGFTGTKTQEDIKKNEENKQKKIDEKKNATSNKDIYSESTYEEAKSKYGQGVGNNKYFMSKEAWEKGKAEQSNKEPKKEQSLVANQFGDKKGKTWNDVLTENENDPEKIMNWLNNNPDYKAGELTKKGMSEFGYKQGEDGKWGKDDSVTNTTGTTAETNTKTKTTTDDALNGIDNITSEDPKAKGFVDSVTNEDGSANEQKALNAMSQYEQKLVEMGAGFFDEDGKFVFKDTTKKGWEDLATMLSVGASVIGIAMGVPIMPINFRKITNKDERDAKIREFQEQYADIMAGNAAKVSGMNADVEAGNIALKNQDALAAQEKHAQATAATKDVIGAQKDAEKELIETRTDAEIRKDEAQFERDMKRLKSDRDFQLKYADLQQRYATEMARLQSDLTTSSTIDIMKYQNSGFLKDLQDLGMSFSDIASYTASKNGISPSDKNWNRVKMVSDMVNDAAGSAAGFVPGNGGKGK